MKQRNAPRVSIVIVTWNGLHLLKQCLPSVLATDYPDIEIIIADNASTDGTAAWIRSTYPNVRVLTYEQNLGFSAGNNRAIEQATGKYVLLLNNDVEVPPDWLWPLVRVMEENPSVGAAQPKFLQFTRRDWFEYSGAAGGYMDSYGYPFSRGRLFFTVEPDQGQYDTPATIFWATGAAMMLRKEALEKIGLLDEIFYLHMEEIDLCWRLQRAGYSIRSVPESRIYHIGGASLPRTNAQKTYYNFRNSLLLLYKNLPPAHWRRIFPRRLLFDVGALLRTLFLLRFKEAAAILRGYRDAYRLHHHYRALRPSSEEKPVLPPYRGSIVIDYYLRFRRRFSDLPMERFLPPYRPVVPEQPTAPDILPVQ